MKAFLKTKGDKIVRPDGSVVFLRGFCLGGWLMQENFITGFPGTEQEFRQSLAEAAGKRRADLFFSRFLSSFIADDDIGYIKKLGATCVRIPFNFRHFENTNDKNGSFNREGFLHLDRIIGSVKKHGLYAILDMHAVPGHQNADWHSDNYFNVPFFWKERFYQNRFIALWEYLADHYKNEPAVAGYDLMNEPVAFENEAKRTLNRIYSETVKRIRKTDSRHIIFLKGNLWGQDFSAFDPPFADHLVYSAHFYSPSAAKGSRYPARINGRLYDRSSLEREMDQRDSFTRRHKVPLWIGEFGAEFTYPDTTASKIRLLDDQIGIFNERGYSWTIWTYKDINHMSTVYPDPASAYMKFVKPVLEAKIKLGCDLWHSSGKAFQSLVRRIADYASPELVAFQERLKGELTRTLGQVFSRFVLHQFCRRISRLGEKQTALMLSSFRFKQCRIRSGLARLLNEKLG